MCDATTNDCGHDHHDSCFCNEDQGAGYTYNDEYSDCCFCAQEFEIGTVVCAGPDNIMRRCPDH